MKPLVNVSMINQYLYCPRRYWYIKFYDTQGENYYQKDGQFKHCSQSIRGGWTKEIYLESKKLGIKGKIDILQNGDKPIERKRGKSYFTNDEMQLTGYCMLLESNIGQEVDKGIIYLFGTDKRQEIPITDWHRSKTEEIIDSMKKLKSEVPPPLTENENKCAKCSTKIYCMPRETKTLQGDRYNGKRKN